MDIEALKWYRKNIDFTENSQKAGKKTIVYPSDPRLGNTYLDVVKSNGLLYFGTPGEYGAENEASKYISVVSSPDKGKIMFVDYPQSLKLTKKTVFPGSANNNRGVTESSPFHSVKLYFAGKESLRLETNSNSNNWKNWT